MTVLLPLITLGLALCSVAQHCGQTPIKPAFPEEIVGGKTAVPYSWPWQVAMFQHILFFNSFECGASVISANFLLTAGHCVYGSEGSPGAFRWKAGVYQKGATRKAGEVVMKAKAIHLHPDYDHEAQLNDVALIELAEPLPFADHIQPVCLPCANSSLAAGDSVTVTGWGAENQGGLFLPSSLRQVTVPVVGPAECAGDYGAQFSPACMLCAGTKGEDSCQGDSGGPLVHQAADGRWIQFGVVSWGYGCAVDGKPGVYSKVAGLMDFIQSVSGVGCV